MTTTEYNPKPNAPEPNQPIEIGVKIVSKSCDIYDLGNGHAAEIPNKDFLNDEPTNNSTNSY